MSDYQQQVPASLSCFMAYDVRGRVPDELNEAVAWRIGRAYAAIIAPRKVVVGHDIRLSSPALLNALADGLMDGGADVYDIGLCGTEEIYFATSHEEMDGGIMVTASHNPPSDNAVKVYWSNGAQVLPPHDKHIIDGVGKVQEIVMGKLPQSSA